MRTTAASRLLSLSVILACEAGHAQFVAEQITDANADALLFGGTDADGGIGDWYLSNGVVEAIIDATGVQEVPAGVTPPPIQNEAAPTGGTLLDLGLVGADNDQLGQMTSYGGLLQNPARYVSNAGSTTASSATITVTGALGNPALVVTTEYTAAGSDPFLSLTTTIRNTGGTPAAGIGSVFDTFFWVLRGALPFSPLAGRGFSHGPLSAAGIESPTFVAAPGNVGPEDGVMDPPSGAASGEVAYGLLGVQISLDQDGPGGAPPLVVPVNSLFGFNNNTLSSLGSSPVAAALNPGGVLSYRRRVYVGGRNDVASVANAMISELAVRRSFATGTISGEVDAADTPQVSASVIATRTGGPAIPGFATGAPATQFRTDAAGAFGNVVLPVGSYDLSFQSVERDPVVVPGIVVTAGSDTPVAVPPMTGRGTVQLRVREVSRAGPTPELPAKVTFIGIEGTPNPRFRKEFDAFTLSAGQPPQDLFPETWAGGPAQANFVYLADGTEAVDLRPGRYELLASRGPEYTVARRVIEVAASERVAVDFQIKRVIDTSGFVSADFHIHSARSFDASAPLEDRAASFAGEGVEVMVGTEHDYHVDYGPIIAAMGIGSWVTSIVGNELTTTQANPPTFPANVGHLNGWPVEVVPNARRDGAIEDDYVAPNLLFSRLRAAGAEVIQYNHARGSLGFFSKIGYDPSLPLDVPPNSVLLDDDVTGASGVANPDGLRNIDFDAMEVMNGISVPGYVVLRRDWLSLLNQVGTLTTAGRVPFIAGTAVSDSHRVTLEEAGYGRTYVGGAGNDPSALDVSSFNANVRGGNMLGTTGPFVEFWLEDTNGARAGLGRTLVPSGSEVRLRIRVQASHWIPVEEVRVISNGFTTRVFDVSTTPGVRPAPGTPWSQGSATDQVVRFDAAVPVTLSEDAYFIVEAGAKLDPAPSPPPFVDKIVPGMVPIAFTNPIFVDLAGDGFDAPGLPVMD